MYNLQNMDDWNRFVEDFKIAFYKDNPYNYRIVTGSSTSSSYHFLYVQNAECPYTIVRSNYGYLKVECKTFYIDVEKLRDEEHSMYMNLSLLNKSVPSKYDFEISDEFLEILVKQAHDSIINYEELFSTYKRIKAEVHKLIQIKTMGLQSWNTSEDFKKEFYDDN